MDSECKLPSSEYKLGYICSLHLDEERLGMTLGVNAPNLLSVL